MSTLFKDLMAGLDEVEAFLAGKPNGCRVTLPAEVDVKAIRKRLNMTQASFSDTFGFSLDAVKHWEGGRRTPESSARAFLTVIARDPSAVITALHQPAMANAAKAPVVAAQKDRWRATRASGPVRDGRPRKELAPAGRAAKAKRARA